LENFGDCSIIVSYGQIFSIESVITTGVTMSKDYRYQGILGNMFDSDHDGSPDWFEKGAELAFLAMVNEELRKEAENDSDYSFRRQRTSSKSSSIGGAYNYVKANRPDLLKKAST